MKPNKPVNKYALYFTFLVNPYQAVYGIGRGGSLTRCRMVNKMRYDEGVKGSLKSNHLELSSYISDINGYEHNEFVCISV